jgi:hypothetical protein
MIVANWGRYVVLSVINYNLAIKRRINLTMILGKKLKEIWSRLFPPPLFALKDVFFFRTQQAISGPLGVKHSLLVWRASNSIDPYVAVADFKLGPLILGGLGLIHTHEIVGSSELSENDYFDFSTRKVLLLKSEAEIKQFFADRVHFPYEKHIVDLAGEKRIP